MEWNKVLKCKTNLKFWDPIDIWLEVQWPLHEIYPLKCDEGKATHICILTIEFNIAASCKLWTTIFCFLKKLEKSDIFLTQKREASPWNRNSKAETKLRQWIYQRMYTQIQKYVFTRIYWFFFISILNFNFLFLGSEWSWEIVETHNILSLLMILWYIHFSHLWIIVIVSIFDQLSCFCSYFRFLEFLNECSFNCIKIL